MAGSIYVRVALIDRDDFCGDGVDWSMRVLGQPHIARGNFPNGGLAKIRAGWFHVEEGSRVELKIGPGGSNSCDTTQVNFKIKLLPDNV